MSKLETKKVLMSMVIALLPLLLLPWLYVLAVSFVLVVNELLGRYFYRHIGGYTGDCLGAAQQVAEVLFYLAVNGLWTFT